MLRQWMVLLLIIAGVIAVDQITKQIVLEQVALYQTVNLIPPLAPFFQITRTENTGAAFGILPSGGDLFLVIAVVVVGAMFYFYPRIEDWPNRIAMGLISGGALGNALDRLQHGVVVDFIHYRLGSISNVSNLADHAIVLGVVVMFIAGWRAGREKPAAQPIDENPTA